MLPIRDENPTHGTPFVNYALLALNVVVWLWQVGVSQSDMNWIIPAYGMVPARVASDPFGEAFTFLTSMFMHGGWAHVGGNMLFLYIFGDNIEEALGHRRYLLFYLLGGAVAAFAQFLINPASTVPMVGASGAIASVLGAYLLLYPRAPVTVLLPPFFLLVFPAWLVVGEWFLMNLLMGFGSLGGSEGGVAFFAHLGGFVAGLLGVRAFMLGRSKRAADRWQGWRPPGRVQRSAFGSSGRPGRRWDPWN